METEIGIWVLCAIGCAVIAHVKGRSVGGWCVLGLLFAVIALVIVALLPATDGQGGAWMACPVCAEPIRAQALECRYCHHEVVIKDRY